MNIDPVGESFWSSLKNFGKNTIKVAAVFIVTAVVVTAVAAGTVVTCGTGAVAVPAVLTLTAEALVLTGFVTAGIGTGATLTGLVGETIVSCSKGHQGNMRDSGLIDLSDEDIENRIRSHDISKKEKLRLQKEQKARRTRNKRKRSNYFRSK